MWLFCLHIQTVNYTKICQEIIGEKGQLFILHKGLQTFLDYEMWGLQQRMLIKLFGFERLGTHPNIRTLHSYVVSEVHEGWKCGSHITKRMGFKKSENMETHANVWWGIQGCKYGHMVKEWIQKSHDCRMMYTRAENVGIIWLQSVWNTLGLKMLKSHGSRVEV